MSNWTYDATPQPIETCPIGQHVLVWQKDRWVFSYNEDQVAVDIDKKYGITHWLPMPPPPTEPKLVPQRCPVCGSGAVVGGMCKRHGNPCVMCDEGCGLCGPEAEDKTRAVEAWNRIRYEA